MKIDILFQAFMYKYIFSKEICSEFFMIIVFIFGLGGKIRSKTKWATKTKFSQFMNRIQNPQSLSCVS